MCFLRKRGGEKEALEIKGHWLRERKDAA